MARALASVAGSFAARNAPGAALVRMGVQPVALENCDALGGGSGGQSAAAGREAAETWIMRARELGLGNMRSGALACSYVPRLAVDLACGGGQCCSSVDDEARRTCDRKRSDRESTKLSLKNMLSKKSSIY